MHGRGGRTASSVLKPITSIDVFFLSFCFIMSLFPCWPVTLICLSVCSLLPRVNPGRLFLSTMEEKTITFGTTNTNISEHLVGFAPLRDRVKLTDLKDVSSIVKTSNLSFFVVATLLFLISKCQCEEMSALHSAPSPATLTTQPADDLLLTGQWLL